MSNRDVVDRYLDAIVARDLDAVSEMQDPEIVGRYPQSGETFTGRDNYMAMQAAYPGLPKPQLQSVTGESNTLILPSAFPFANPTVTVFGGDQFVVEGIATYPDGDAYNVVVLLRLRGGRVIEETVYFAAPFAAAEWRRQYAD